MEGTNCVAWSRNSRRKIFFRFGETSQIKRQILGKSFCAIREHRGSREYLFSYSFHSLLPFLFLSATLSHRLCTQFLICHAAKTPLRLLFCSKSPNSLRIKWWFHFKVIVIDDFPSAQRRNQINFFLQQWSRQENYLFICKYCKIFWYVWSRHFEPYNVGIWKKLSIVDVSSKSIDNITSISTLYIAIIRKISLYHSYHLSYRVSFRKRPLGSIVLHGQL